MGPVSPLTVHATCFLQDLIVFIREFFMSNFKEGLQDIVAASSSICYIDGDRGVLSYRGIDIHELAEKSNF